MKTIRVICAILLLQLWLMGCKGSRSTTVINQFAYSYNAENFGYSDIQKLYSADTLTKNQPFFSSESLQHLEMTMAADLSITILTQTKDSLLLCYQLVSPKVDIKTEGVSIQLETILQDLLKPVFVRAHTSGKIGMLKFEAEVSETAVGLYKDIIARMQFIKPKKNTKEWQTSEENTQGTYRAVYKLQPKDGRHKKYTKNVLDYLTYSSKSDNQELNIEQYSTIEADALGTLKRIHTSEVQTLLQNKDTLSVLGAKVLVLIKDKKQVQQSVISDLLGVEKSEKYSHKTSLSEGVSDEDIRKMAYQETLGADSWETLMSQLSALKDLNQGFNQNLDLKFRALFYLQPAYCNTAVSYLNNHLEHTIAFKVLSTALAMTETPSATNAIAMLLEKNKGNEDFLRILIPVLSTTEYPTPMAIKVLKSIAFGPEESQGYFIKSTAQLALGGMAYHLRQSNPLQAKKLTRYLLEEKKFKNDTIQQLLVLGNTGSPLVFPFITSLVGHAQASEQVKVEAISALKRIKDRQVFAYLKKMSQHNNAAIRQKAVEVFEYQKNRREE
ncbi:hypothetical protein MWU65_08140 [Cellulophaga sp. F20128]|uniref:hypothetical protein n=1 Tax=Cellulophaga sp. F20128 TaxID=2926413 RepID=UPI001FF3B778|nr:hypothetical protein [Cellulophaga sp. F20128]MCK0157141.1 hypothetical protein [Cellulophaga sp. F20128]